MAKKGRNENEIGALWKRKSKNGVSFYSGTIDLDADALQDEGGKVKIVVFPVKEKSKDEAPDARILKSVPFKGDKKRRNDDDDDDDDRRDRRSSGRRSRDDDDDDDRRERSSSRRSRDDDEDDDKLLD